MQGRMFIRPYEFDFNIIYRKGNRHAVIQENYIVIVPPFGRLNCFRAGPDQFRIKQDPR
jgi:hypothetical protein